VIERDGGSLVARGVEYRADDGAVVVVRASNLRLNLRPIPLCPP
jgi:hypothetical protein